MTVGSAGRTPTTAVPAPVWRVAVVLASGSVMTGLDTSLVNVGIEIIGRELDASLTEMQWINSGYLLALAAALPTCGWVSRRIGTGRLWLWALAGFTLTSALCALARSADTLIAARVLQGLTGGLLIPTGMAILGQVAGSGRMGRVIAVSSVPAILAPAFGPIIGALLIDNFSWRWMFLVNVPIGIVGLLVALRVVPRGAAGRAARPDVPALFLVALGLPLLTYAVTAAMDRRGLFAAAVLAPLAVALVALVLFVHRSLRAAEPLMDLRLTRDPVYAAAASTIFFSSAALFGGLIVMPLYFQLAMARGIIDTGLLLMAFSLGATVTFPVAGRLTDRHGGGIVTVVGLVVTVAGTVPMAVLPSDPNVVLVEALQVVRGVGLALAGSPVVSAALARVRSHQMPDASAQVNILSRVGGAVGSALCVVVLADALADARSEVEVAAAFRSTFWWLTGMAAVALVLATWLTRAQRGARRTGPK
ncbi:DHA2 family efflux MFS transporter permease subunit [Micromonospora sp. RL09-050-HVF-A]|uniref:DHA2 family efflux MFS transporter permease subunit n=1 Tax=Micromonospora sp. RL09-050-HVF-A TaxID=1703433 RepID=UPI001C5FE7C3|nr:DHA2 family efflux MFS transporter permease subunit [Micromonospora sp. RL09-050-HVF-A]MBW4704554.1 DHA2 family efflux MFS transporter permease subunit [Micromonospora sp. RL09-050-HVF-A]